MIPLPFELLRDVIHDRYPNRELIADILGGTFHLRERDLRRIRSSSTQEIVAIVSDIIFPESGNTYRPDLFPANPNPIGAPKSMVDHLKDAPLPSPSTPCTICLETVGSGVTLGCKHVFHAECIKGWLANHQTCPNCRATAAMVVPTLPTNSNAAKKTRAGSKGVAKSKKVKSKISVPALPVPALPVPALPVPVVGYSISNTGILHASGCRHIRHLSERSLIRVTRDTIEHHRVCKHCKPKV